MKYKYVIYVFSSILLICTSSHAAELIYQPNNPSFGGNPMNGSHLLNTAQAQNDYTDPRTEARRSSSGYTPPSALDRFASSLQSRMLNQLLNNIDDGQTGTLETDQFTINIQDDGDGSLNVHLLDKVTGETTSISVNGLVTD